MPIEQMVQFVTILTEPLHSYQYNTQNPQPIIPWSSSLTHEQTAKNEQ